jgi:hypothetical protein
MRHVQHLAMTMKCDPSPEMRTARRSFSQLYRERAESENPFDELKNQWVWGGFTTRDFERCQIIGTADRSRRKCRGRVPTTFTALVDQVESRLLLCVTCVTATFGKGTEGPAFTTHFRTLAENITPVWHRVGRCYS